MSQYTPGSAVHFAVSYRQEDETLIDPVNPRVVFTDTLAGTTTVALTKEGDAVGQYSASWTIPASAAVGLYDFYYAGTFPPFAGADPAEWQSNLNFLEVVPAGTLPPSGASLAGLALNALTTLGAMKEELGIADSDTSSDNRIKRMINAASGRIEKLLNRDLGKATVTEELCGRNRQTINLRRYPVIEVVAAKLDGAAVTDYKLLSATNQLWRRYGWPLAALTYRDLTVDADPRTADLNVEVTYKGGYVLPRDANDANSRTLPWDIEWACIRMVASWFNRDPALKSEQTPGGYRYEVDPKLLGEIAEDLKLHKRWA